MQSHVYTVFDRVADEAGPVFVAKNDGIALRSCAHMLREVGAENQGDYILLRIGTYESSPVRLTGFDIPVQVTKNTPVEENQ